MLHCSRCHQMTNEDAPHACPHRELCGRKVAKTCTQCAATPCALRIRFDDGRMDFCKPPVIERLRRRLS